MRETPEHVKNIFIREGLHLLLTFEPNVPRFYVSDIPVLFLTSLEAFLLFLSKADI